MPTELAKLSKSEMKLMGALLSGENKAIEISIPDDLAPKTAVEWSKLTASLLDKNDGERAILLQVAGRLHFLARNNPKILEESGCENLSEYEDRILNCRDHRTTIWKYSSAYKAFPELTLAAAATIGTTNLARAAKIANGASESQKAEILEHAKEAPEKFKEWAEEKSGLSAPGATTGAMFQLFGSKEQVDELKEFLADEGFRGHSGSDHPLSMILSAIKEASTEWAKQEDDGEDVEDEATSPGDAAEGDW